MPHLADKKITVDDFDNEYSVNSSRYFHCEDRIREFFPLCDFEGRKTILDLGCGAGWLGHHLSAKHDVTLVDFSPKAVEFARVNAPNCQVFCADMVTFAKEKKAKYDVVILTDVVEEIYQEQLEPVLSAIDDADILIMSTPTHENYLKMSTHLVIYEKEELMGILAAHGWKLDKVVPYSDRLIGRFVK